MASTSRVPDESEAWGWARVMEMPSLSQRYAAIYNTCTLAHTKVRSLRYFCKNHYLVWAIFHSSGSILKQARLDVYHLPVECSEHEVSLPILLDDLHQLFI